MATTDSCFAHVMLIEDDDSLAALVCDYLREQGYQVTWIARGDIALEEILTHQPDIVLLDLMLPGKSGTDVCSELRTQSDVPVIMLTARSDEIDQIIGLELGADDYICKPVQPRLLLARITSLLRRSNKTHESEKAASGAIRFGQLAIYPHKQEVMLSGKPISLTTNEMDLLTCFADKPDTVLSRDDLMTRLRGFEYDGIDRTVDMLVSRLRRKLEANPAEPKRIRTIWRKGYVFVSDAW